MTAMPSGRVEDTEGYSLLHLATILLRHVRIVVGIPIVTMVLVLAAALAFSGSDYTVTSSFLPQVSPNPLGGYSNLASQFGLTLPSNSGGAAGESVAFYASLVTSRSVMEDVVLTRFPLAGGGTAGDSATLVEMWGADGENEAERLQNTIRMLKERVSTRVDPNSGLISVTTRSGRPDLSVAINRRILNLISEYNLNRRQSRAGAERRFAEMRMEEARKALVEAESAWQEFLSRNRSFESPQLSFEAARLQRQTEFHQQVYTTLAQAVEQARMEEVRNTPVITIVDDPEGAAVPVDRPLLLWAAAAGLLGLLLGAFVAFARESVRTTQLENPDVYSTFVSLRRSAVRRLLPDRVSDRGRT